MKGAERQKRIQALMAAHNTAAIPTKYLPAKQAQQRDLNARLNAPVVPGSGLTNRDLAHEAQAAISVQYGPQEQALQQQLASAHNQPAQTGSYYDAYIKQLQQAAAQQPTLTQGLVAQQQALGGSGSSGQAAAQGQNQNILAGMQADAAQRGATVDPSLAQTFQQGTNVNAGMADARAGTAGLLGQVQGNYLQGLIAAAQIGKASALNEVAGKTNDLMGQQTRLKAEEGQANLTYRGKRRAEEGQSVLNTALAQSTIASKAASAQTAAENVKIRKKQVQDAAAGRTADDTRADATFAATHEGLTPTEFAAKSPSEQLAILRRVKKATTVKTGKTAKKKPTTGPGSLSDSQEQKRVDQIEKVYGLLTNPVVQVTDPTTGKVRTSKLTPVEMRDRLRAQAVNPLVLKVALSRFHNKGGVGPDGLRAAHSLGVHVGGRWKVVKSGGGASSYGGKT